MHCLQRAVWLKRGRDSFPLSSKPQWNPPPFVFYDKNQIFLKKFFEKTYDANFCVFTKGVCRLITANTRANNLPLTLFITSIFGFPSDSLRS